MNINESDLRTLLDSTHDVVAAVFSAKWCGPCRTFAPIVEKVSEKYANVVRLDVDECTQLCEDINIVSVPTVIIFKDAKVITRKEGSFPSESHFTNWLDGQGVKRK